MIDYLSLALGHGLLAIVFLRLVMSEALEVDPSIQEYKDLAEAERESSRRSGRNAARRKAADAKDETGQDQSNNASGRGR